jgi:hypothetical protein
LYELAKGKATKENSADGNLFVFGSGILSASLIKADFLTSTGYSLRPYPWAKVGCYLKRAYHSKN